MRNSVAMVSVSSSMPQSLPRSLRQSPQHSLSHTGAFFDLDHTLLRSNCASAFGIFLLKRGRAPLKILAHYFFGGILYLLYLYSPDAFLRRQVLYLAGKSVTKYTQLADQLFLPHPERFFRDEVVQRYRWHQEEGHRCFIITQSYNLLAQYFVDVLKPDALISTELEVRDGRFTGRARFSSSHDKYRAANTLAKKYRLDLTQSYAYTDSVHDIKMLKAVGNVIVVNPKMRLSRAAHQRGWKVLKVKRRRKR